MISSTVFHPPGPRAGAGGASADACDERSAARARARAAARADRPVAARVRDRWQCPIL